MRAPIGSWPRLPGFWLAMYFLGYLVWFVLADPGEVKTAWSDFAYLPPETVALTTGVLLVAVRRDLPRRSRVSWGLITAAIACRFFADTSWWWLEGVRHLSPFPGLPDVGYVAFYPFMLAGLLLKERRHRGTHRQRLLDTLDVVTISASAFVAVWYFALGPIITDVTDHGLAAFLDVYYPVADVVLVAAAARVLILSATRSAAVVLLLGACVLLVAADTAYPYLSEPGSAIGGEWVDLLWVGSCVMVASAVTARWRAPATSAPRTERSPSLVPLLSVLIAGLVLVRSAIHLPSYPVLLTAVAVVVVMCSTAWRQMIANREYANLAMRYRQLAIRDTLTGVMSRLEGLAQGEALQAECDRRGQPCGVLMLDMDRFKQVNDELGHPTGDVVLAAVAHRISGAVRDHDLVCRYGGDEFLVVLPGADEAVTAEVAARVERDVAAGPVTVGPHVIPVGITAGIASAPGRNLDTLIQAADDALRVEKGIRRATSARGHAVSSG